MESTERKNHAEAQLQGFASHLLEEVIRADISMQNAQLDAWKHFMRSRPEGEYVNPNILDGFPNGRHLFVHDVTLDFQVKCIPTDTFWKRLKQAWYLLKGSPKQKLYRPMICDICDRADPAGIRVSVKISRSRSDELESSVAFDASIS